MQSTRVYAIKSPVLGTPTNQPLIVLHDFWSSKPQQSIFATGQSRYIGRPRSAINDASQVQYPRIQLKLVRCVLSPYLHRGIGSLVPIFRCLFLTVRLKPIQQLSSLLGLPCPYCPKFPPFSRNTRVYWDAHQNWRTGALMPSMYLPQSIAKRAGCIISYGVTQSRLWGSKPVRG